MPPRTPKPTNPKVRIETIVQLPLQEGDGVHIAAIVLKPDELIQAVNDYVEIGWSFHTSRNAGRNGYSTFVGYTDPGSRNSGRGFYANGNTPIASMACAVWKLGNMGKSFLDDFGLSQQGGSDFS